MTFPIKTLQPSNLSTLQPFNFSTKNDLAAQPLSCLAALTDLRSSIIACETAIRAGINMFIYRNSTPETIQIIETIAEKAKYDKELEERIEEAVGRIMKLKANKRIS